MNYSIEDGLVCYVSFTDQSPSAQVFDQKANNPNKLIIYSKEPVFKNDFIYVTFETEPTSEKIIELSASFPFTGLAGHNSN